MDKSVAVVVCLVNVELHVVAILGLFKNQEERNTFVLAQITTVSLNVSAHALQSAAAHVLQLPNLPICTKHELQRASLRKQLACLLITCNVWCNQWIQVWLPRRKTRCLTWRPSSLVRLAERHDLAEHRRRPKRSLQLKCRLRLGCAPRASCRRPAAIQGHADAGFARSNEWAMSISVCAPPRKEEPEPGCLRSTHVADSCHHPRDSRAPNKKNYRAYRAERSMKEAEVKKSPKEWTVAGPILERFPIAEKSRSDNHRQSSVDVLFRATLQQMDLGDVKMKLVDTTLFGFAGEVIHPMG
ncbi:hypothetical protein BUALT_Bualt03G0204600 [Buddleja alternifolia]|uniref:Uncharacterized protein n=1 Tax=Buddleja alternifolia TaxID=168488 RepID=A0AAV6XVC7_9LAMI|nr:hypothetical protein BUALT_Bualt03G0204600 [Buddleja alternifolia]